MTPGKSGLLCGNAYNIGCLLIYHILLRRSSGYYRRNLLSTSTDDPAQYPDSGQW